MLSLEWDTEHDEPPAPADSVVSESDSQPLEKLKEMARLGYVRGFRDVLKTYVAANQLSDEEGSALEELAQRFRFDEVIAHLARTGDEHHDTE